MKARDLINALMDHDVNLEVFARVRIVNPDTKQDEWIDVPLGDVKRQNDGGPWSPRLTIEAPAVINAEVEYKFSIA